QNPGCEGYKESGRCKPPCGATITTAQPQIAPRCPRRAQERNAKEDYQSEWVSSDRTGWGRDSPLQNASSIEENRFPFPRRSLHPNRFGTIRRPRSHPGEIGVRGHRRNYLRCDRRKTSRIEPRGSEKLVPVRCCGSRLVGIEPGLHLQQRKAP